MKLNFKFSTFDQLSGSNTPLCDDEWWGK
jgi:hypothetical protein